MLPDPNKAEQALHDLIRQYGCIVCKLYWQVYSEPEIHHILSGQRRVSHSYVLGLCPRHHRQPGKGYETRHSDRGSSGKAAFEKAYGDEHWLYEAQDQLIHKYAESVSI